MEVEFIINNLRKEEEKKGIIMKKLLVLALAFGFGLVSTINLAFAEDSAQIIDDQITKEGLVQIKESAPAYAKEHGISEASMEEVLSLFIRADKADKISSGANKDSEKAEYYQLRSKFFKDLGSSVLLSNIVLREMKEVMIELKQEQKTSNYKRVSPEMSRKINIVSSKATKVSLMMVGTCVSLTEMASWEAVHSKGGYNSKTETFEKSIAKIQVAVSLVTKAVEPFGDALLSSVVRRFEF